MDKFVIDGPTPLRGNVSVHGAKNAVLPLMAAALLARGNRFNRTFSMESFQTESMMASCVRTEYA